MAPKNVEENYEIYDCCLIGAGVDAKYPGGFASFAAMALAEEIPFCNIRNSSEAGKAYTNITSKDKLPWGFKMESIGMRFLLPSPSKAIDTAAGAELAKTKFWLDAVMEHAFFEFKIREDVILTVKPAMIPGGIGPVGNQFAPTTAESSYIITNGTPYVKNRFSYGKRPIGIPRDTPIQGTLKFSEIGKELLTAMGDVGVLHFGTTAVPVVVNNTAIIELTLRGYRLVQQRGEWHFSAGE